MDAPTDERIPFHEVQPGDLFTVPDAGILWMKVYPGIRRADGTPILCVQVGGSWSMPGTLDAWDRSREVLVVGHIAHALRDVLTDEACGAGA